MEWIDRSLVEAPCHIGLVTTEKQFQAQLRRMNVSKDEWPAFLSGVAIGSVHQFSAGGGLGIILVCIRKDTKRKRVDTDGILIHEAIHVWQKIKRYIGEHSPSDEFEAYSVENIFKGLVKAYHKK